jgi:hypothetical protein
MSLRRLNPRRDQNEADIIDALERCGFTVARLSARGVPDLVIGKQRVTKLAEVKRGKAQLNEAQQAWWDIWNGNDLIILRLVEDVTQLAKHWPRHVR